MKHAHHAREHLRRVILVDVEVLAVVKPSMIAEYASKQSADLLLITLSIFERYAGAVETALRFS